MRRIDEHTVHFDNDVELVISEIHDLLLDQGYSQGDALILLRGSRVPEGLRSPTPVLDAALTPELASWLGE